MITKFNIFENNTYPVEKLGKRWCLFMDESYSLDSNVFKRKHDIYEYRDVKFAWHPIHRQYMLVRLVTNNGEIIDDDITMDCAVKGKCNMGSNFDELIYKIDNYHIEREGEKYNL